MTPTGSLLEEEKTEYRKDYSDAPTLEDLTSSEESPLFKGGIGQRRKLRAKKFLVFIDSTQSLIESDIINLFRAEDVAEIVMGSPKKIKSVSVSLPYTVSLFVSTAVSIICGMSIYSGVVTGKTLLDPYLSIFWFIGGIGFILMSLKGIFK